MFKKKVCWGTEYKLATKGRVCTTTLGNVWCYYVNPQISGDWLAKYKDKDIKVYVEVLDEDK